MKAKIIVSGAVLAVAVTTGMALAVSDTVNTSRPASVLLQEEAPAESVAPDATASPVVSAPSPKIPSRTWVHPSVATPVPVASAAETEVEVVSPTPSPAPPACDPKRPAWECPRPVAN